MSNTGKDQFALLEALNRSQAVIEFDLEGNILNANDNFLQTMGYSLDEIKGKHHSMFAEPGYAASQEYQNFWDILRSGEFMSAEYQRFGKGGREVWIQASYNPIMDRKGRPYKVVKFATNITDQKKLNMDYHGQIVAIGRSQAVIEFTPDGTILNANDNFLKTMGYTKEEVVGKHHSMFADSEYAQSQEYKDFWKKLQRGEYMAGEFKRFGKGGKEVWIQASYNPIIDIGLKTVKIVKYASDITAQKIRNLDFQEQIDAIGRSQAVIEFDMSGTILNANENFLQTMGYTKEEVIGKHHSMFADSEYANSQEYTDFWQKLRRGEYEAGEFKRSGKGGRPVWIQASYNPIFDPDHKPIKVVKYASDITKIMDARQEAGSLTNNTMTNVQTIAAASEEMLASIQEISRSMTQSTEAVRGIVGKTKEANDLATRLTGSSASMESVVSLIRDIAEQVNLLALNATIEAARAGEAGKGFAVVAGEVKNLAAQTSSATDQIAQEIIAMQQVVAEVSKSTSEINGSTEEVSDSVNSVASAVEEQTAVTNEISAGMQKISIGVEELNACVERIAGHA